MAKGKIETGADGDSVTFDGINQDTITSPVEFKVGSAYQGGIAVPANLKPVSPDVKKPGDRDWIE